MRHQANDVALFAAKARDVGHRSIGIGIVCRHTVGIRVTKNNLAVTLEASNNLGIRVVIALAMSDRDAQDLSRGAGGGEWRIRLLDFDQYVLALILQAAVAKHGTWKQACFEQYLETVANSQHGAARGRELLHLGHDGREARNRAGAQVVAVRKATWKD